MDNQVFSRLEAAYTPGQHTCVSNWVHKAGLYLYDERHEVEREMLTALAARIPAAAVANHIRAMAKNTQNGATWGGYHRLAKESTVPTWEQALACWKAAGNDDKSADSRTRFFFQTLVASCVTDEDVRAYLDEHRSAVALWEPNPEAAERRIKGLAKIFGKEISHA